MTARDWIAAVGIVFTLVAAAMAYGEMAGNVEDAREEIRLLRSDMRAINEHFIVWASQHKDKP